MKKLNLLFTAILLLCCVGNAKAVEVTIDGIKYDVYTYTKQATVIKGGNYSGDIVIPSEITYNNVICSVTSIGKEAFQFCDGLTSITIPNSVKSIEELAFLGCSGLKRVTIPNSITSIGEGAFGACSGLTSVIIGNSVTSIEYGAFFYCENLTDVYCLATNVPDTYGYNPFEGSYPEHMTLHVAAEAINSYKTTEPWSSFGSIVEIFAGGGMVIDGIKYSINVNTKQATVISGGNYSGEIVVPSEITYNNVTYCVTSIGSSAFEDCSGVTSITIPNSVTSIGDRAFHYCYGLTSITIPNSVTSIGDRAFYYCYGLTSITIPNSVTSIGGNTFYNCKGLKEVYNFSNLTFAKGSSDYGYIAYYADNVYNVPNGSIEGNYIFCKLNNVNTLVGYLGSETELTLPADYKGEGYVIGASAFKGNNTITSIEIPNSVTSIGYAAFSGCKGLTSVTIGNRVTSIGEQAFYYCSGLTSVTIGNSVTSIGNFAFAYCFGLTSITIPNNVKSIGNEAFACCFGLTSITIPNSVTSIGKEAFYYCDGLKEVHINDLAAWCSIDFGSSDANPLYYAHNLYLNNELITELDIPSSITEINDYAFCGCDGLTSITIPNSVTSIESYAFYSCDGLTSITIPNSVTSIGNYAFSGCSGLESIIIEYGNTKYDSRENCNAIIETESNTLIAGCKNTIIPNSVTSIGERAFYKCSGLTSITIPNSVTSIGEEAFQDCNGLKTVYNFSNFTFAKGSSDYGYIARYADNVYNAPNGSIEGDYIFAKPTNVNTLVGYLGSETELTLPADYKGESYVIGASAFNGNNTITSITIPNSVTSVVASAFKGCSGLEKVCISNLVAWCGIDFGSADANPLYYAHNLYLNGELVTNLSIPAEITEVKDYAFYNCKGVTNIDIVDQVRSIGNSAFYGCSDLETLYISNTIENIYDYAFAECNNILDIKIGSKKAITASENIFSSDTYNNACLYVPEGRKFAYEKTSPWDNFYMQEIDYTGIEDINAENENVKTIYDLQGRRVENPTEGIYIINGKKTFVK